MSGEDDPLRIRLTRLAAKTATATNLESPSWWVGDHAGERRVHDDLATGRLDWRAAHNAAHRGLEALESGDPDMALLYAWVATDHYVAAIESRLRPSDREVLTRSASRRGRPRKKNEK